MSTTAERRAAAVVKISEPRPQGSVVPDALLVTSLHNIRYLTGFTGSNASLLLGADGSAKFFTDPRYTLQAGTQVDFDVTVAKGPLTKSVLKAIAKARYQRIAIEQDNLTVGAQDALRKDLPSRAQLIPISGLVEKLRMVKDEQELAAIRKSVALNSEALEAALSHMKPGMTETDLAAEIDYRSRLLGADGPAFDTIVASGERSALPHAHPGSTMIGSGILLIDMGAFVDAYASDMTRMVHIGKPGKQFKKAYKAVLEAQLAAIDAVKPGVKTSKVDKAARHVLKAHDLDKEFTHSTGHGLGLEIHERPRIGRKDSTVLEVGMAITIEPGIYIEGWGGIRIEDTVVVTESGCEILTPTSKDLRMI
jgi:Xaa-Pro aminopeptidase